MLLLLVKIVASYRLSLVELLCRTNCCSIHALKPRTVEWNGKSRPSVIKRPPSIQASWHYFSLTHVQVFQTLLTCFEFELLDVISLLTAQKEITLHFNFLSNLPEAAFFMLVQAGLKKKSAVLRIFFNKTMQSNMLGLPNTNILLLISLFATPNKNFPTFLFI